MGIINKDIFVSQYGQSVTDTYISLGNNSIELRKEDNKYLLLGVFNVWLSKSARETNKSSFKSIIIHKELTSDEIISNIYGMLYSELKKKYTNTTDDI